MEKENASSQTKNEQKKLSKKVKVQFSMTKDFLIFLQGDVEFWSPFKNQGWLSFILVWKKRKNEMQCSLCVSSGECTTQEKNCVRNKETNEEQE